MTPSDMAALHSAAMRDRPWTAAEFEGLLSAGARAIGAPEAFALYRIAADEAELLTIATNPGMRRLGLARTLLSHVHRAARDAGANRVFLEVAGSNTAARALYDTSGYVEVGRRPDYYRTRSGGREAAIVMEKVF